MEKGNLSSPWATFCREIGALPGGDPQIKVQYDEENNNIKVFADDEEDEIFDIVKQNSATAFEGNPQDDVMERLKRSRCRKK